MRHLGYERCIVMGTSGGAVAALWMAILFPKAIKAVIADSCVRSITKEFVYKHIVKNRALHTPDQIQFWKFAHGEDWEQVVRADTEMIKRFVEERTDWFSGRLDEVQCPVMLTASKGDQSLPDVVIQNSDMLQRINDCRLYIHSTGGHPLMWSGASIFRAVSDQFLREVQ